ncbi:PRC-barrel domain-containing protein [Belnapia sp. T6]|uniref:PRC-barrel domain-containing protein n=1 Tax=Belnapia mucosa TaxID=2804532 RepID=A0ABS1UZR3_9PROT|nr:PRC-barrel domain-containing protein [Belnapia mucosa]MBL6454944.1 PRC-barrel domain-containing protein [Belnapia mucosa]
MTNRTQWIAMTAAAGLLALPCLALGQTAPQANPPGTPPNRVDSMNGARTNTDGTPGNPPSTATQRGVDSTTGNRTPADGTPGNPPGTAAGRAVDRALGTNTTGAHPENERNRTASPANTGAATGTLAVDSAALHNGRRASKVIGSAVYNENNESIGEVDDILIPPGGTSPVAVISVGGFLGIGAKLVAVPYDRLNMAANSNGRWTLTGATKESLGSLPTFTYEGTATDRRG